MQTPIAPASILGGSSESRRAAIQFLNRLVWLSMILLIAGLCRPAHAQTGEWVWMGGSKTLNQPSVYGTLGTPAAGNVPGSRSFATTWTDGGGHLWLFGGSGLDAGGNNVFLNDLWEFNPSTSEWTWMGGSNTYNQPGVYGTLGTPAPGNTPGARQDASTWVDGSGHIWLFGGTGVDSAGNSGEWNDLWEFNPSTNEWAWMGGSSTIVCSEPYGQPYLLQCGQPGVYGTLGTPAAGNIPGGRSRASKWTDASGNFWLFGGLGFPASPGWENNLNDLWEFNPSTNEWSWMGGSSTGGQGPEYGTLGTPAPGNIPGGRQGASSWIDRSGNLWLFGGEGSSTTYWGSLNDVWVFSPPTNEWAWMGGSNTEFGMIPYEPGQNGAPGVFGALGTPAPDNIPFNRWYARSWTDSNGNAWLFGGIYIDASYVGGWDNTYGFNDVWEFYPSTNEWAWMGGSDLFNQKGSYGTLGTLAVGNIPGIHYYASSWTDSNGNFWLFGGDGIDANGNRGLQNDLWEFLPAATSIAAPPTFSVSSGTYTSSQTVKISETTPGTAIYYTLDGTTPTTASAKYRTALKIGGISQTITVNALAAGYCCTSSSMTSATYTFNLLPAAAPVFTLPGGTYPSTQSVQISSTTPGAVIYYTAHWLTSQNQIVWGDPVEYASAVTVSAPITFIDAYAVAYGYTTSAVASAVYTIRPAAPTFSLPSGEYLTPQSLSISDTTPGATIYYTADGSAPSPSAIPYTSAIAINQNMTIRATAVLSGYASSPHVSVEYAIKAPALTFSLPSGEYLAPQSLTISAPGATIYYTTNGSSPSANSTLYTGAIAIDKNVKIRATAVIPGYANSQYAGAAYAIKAPAPTFSLPSGIYPGPQQVSISDSMAGAAIYYTTDGTTPTAGSTPYTGSSITVSSKEKIIAVATATGYANSPLVAAAYGIKSGGPVF
ncbi:MAG TPA: chitobiase/beta-hexosaminidase C-terminal domain-containing protein [Terracidiphilus sp.]|jgi:N-acetylneuraminic acid mutarotase|nr:chitobiase/beta-hexosaminidase C-terminal domain-containing protein [Terracidiphilus sp.]